MDEAVAFRKKEVAQYLYAQGATLKKVSQESLNALLFPPKKGSEVDQLTRHKLTLVFYLFSMA